MINICDIVEYYIQKELKNLKKDIDICGTEYELQELIKKMNEIHKGALTLNSTLTAYNSDHKEIDT